MKKFKYRSVLQNSLDSQRFSFRAEALKKVCKEHNFISAGESRKTNRRFFYCDNCGHTKIEYLRTNSL